MGVGAGVQHDADGLAAGGVDGVHQRALVVGLEALDVEPVRVGGVLGELLDVGQRGRAVLLRLAGAEEVQVGAVEDKDGAAAGFGGGGGFSHDCKSIAPGCRTSGVKAFVTDRAVPHCRGRRPAVRDG